MAKEREFCCTITAPSIINFKKHCICQYNVNGHFPIRHWLTLQASDHIPRKCEIWKYVDYHINIQSILTSNGFLDISIHIWSCGCDFWKYLLSFSHTNSPKLTVCTYSDNLPTFPDFTLPSKVFIVKRYADAEGDLLVKMSYCCVLTW